MIINLGFWRALLVFPGQRYILKSKNFHWNLFWVAKSGTLYTEPMKPIEARKLVIRGVVRQITL